MNRFKYILLVVTVILGFMGIAICRPSGRETSVENQKYLAYNLLAITNTPIPTIEQVVTNTPTPAHLESNVQAVSSKESNVMADNSSYISNDDDEIEIPEIVIAEVDDVEDPQPAKKAEASVTKTPVALPTKAPAVTKVVTKAPVEKEDDEEEIPETEEVIYEDYTMVGIDVSKWNGVIDWKKVADAGVEFAMIRTGYRGNTYGKIVADPYFYDNIEGALANGIKVGVYFYSQAINEKEAKQEAAWVCELIKDYNITFPVAYDLEEVNKNRIKNVSYAQLNKNARVFLDYVKKKGYTPCMYGCKSYLLDVWDMSMFSDCYVWLAHYVKETTYKEHYDMWQYTDSGRIDGISEYVDLNIAYFHSSKSTEATPVPTESPTPEPTEKVTVKPTATPEPTATLEESTTPEPIITSEPEFAELEESCLVLVEEGSLSVYTMADKDSGVLGTLENGDKVVRIGIYSNGWSAILYGETTAYVTSENLSVITEEPPTPSITPETSEEEPLS